MKRLSLVLLAAAGIVLAWRMNHLEPPRKEGGRTEVQALFEDLQSAGLIQVQGDAGLEWPPEDQRLVGTWRGQPLIKEHSNLIRELHRTAAGTALLWQIRLWNQSRRLAAVRDNSKSQGIEPGRWQAHDCTDGSLLEGTFLVPESFGYIHQGQIKIGFGDWRAWSTDRDCVELRGYFDAKDPRPLRVFYIGQAMPGQGLVTFEPPHRKLPACAGSLPQAQAGEWRLPLNAWRRASTGGWELEAKLRIKVAVNPELAAQGLRIGMKDDCRPFWRPEAAELGAGDDDRIPDPGQSSRWVVETRDGQPLLDMEGKPTKVAQELGLIPLVGFGPGDHHSLSGWLKPRDVPGRRLKLTLDARFQAAAREALTRGLERFPKNDPSRDERRAALVLLDGEGAVLAIAGHPLPPPLDQVTPWDLAAFARVYPLDDPLQVRAWEGVDRHNAPGSSFKLVTALAGLEAAGQNPQIAGMLAGLKEPEFKQLTGLDLKAMDFDPFWNLTAGYAGGKRPTIKNFRGKSGHFETLGDLLHTPLSRNCAGQADKPGNLGLPSALRDSLNIWFSALAVLAEGGAVDAWQTQHRPGSKHPAPSDLHFVHILKGFGFAEPGQELFAALPQDLRQMNNRPRMEADQLDLLGDEPSPLRWVLAQHAIGQGVQVTPMRMAALAASLAQGAVVPPHLDAAWNDIPVRPAEPTPLGLDLSLIHSGMRAVVQTGTAESAFEKLPAAVRCHTWAKTGTAQIGTTSGAKDKESFNTAWLVGWHQPEGQVRRIVFACMITHAHGESTNTGGEVCGPVVADVLQRLRDKIRQ